MKTTLLLSALLFTMSCSGAGKMYVGDLTVTTVENGITKTTRDSNFAIDIQHTARGGLLVDDFNGWGAVHLDQMTSPGMGGNNFQLGYAPPLSFTESKGTRKTYEFAGQYTAATSECSTGYCSFEIKGAGEYRDLEDSSTIKREMTWNFSGLAY